MIMEEIVGDLFKTDCQTLTIPVNMVGAMGKGLALYAKKRWPHVDPIYRRHCNTHTFKTRLVTVPIDNAGRQILLLPTKNHWSEESNEWLINRSLDFLARDYQELNIKSLAIPKIGCGNGLMEYDVVKGMIFHHLDPLPIPVKIYI